MNPVFELVPQAGNLTACLRSGGMTHAYLLTGPEGIGKTALAYEMAKIVNCQGRTFPCNGCESCRRIDQGLHSDVYLTRLETEGQESRSAIGTDDIEVIQHSASLPPFEGNCRVFIIDGADLLSASAANRLLKTLEEPPAGVMFILVAEWVENVMPTILSRCQLIECRPLPLEKITDLLVEKHGIDHDRADLLAALSGGRLGWAVQAATKGDFLSDYTEKREKVLEVLSAGYESRFSHVQSMTGRFNRDRKSVTDELSLWLVVGRDVLLAEYDLDQEIVNRDIRHRITETARQFTPAGMVDFLKTVSNTRYYLKRNVNPRLALEAMMLSITPGAGVKTGDY